MESVAPAERPKRFRRLRDAGFRLYVLSLETERWIRFFAVGPFRRHRRFRFDGNDHHYFVRRYNETWANERAVELPIVLGALGRRRGEHVLEVGNVLAHYLDVPHDVVDKYEQAPGVVNQDVLEFDPDTRYDLIVSISTLEHVGFDEDVRDPDKPARAVAHLKGLLRAGGELLISFPLGYNPDIDARLASGSLGFDEVRYLKRVSRSNRWREVPAAEVAGARYGAPYREGNALVFAVSRAPGLV